MNNEIDLSKFQVYTDLAIETIGDRTIDGVKSVVTKDKQVKITDVIVDKAGFKKINKQPGNYITIEFDDVTDYANKEHLKKVFSKKLKDLIDKCEIKDNDSCLIVGLGNDYSTADALGPLTIGHVLVTKHLFLYEDVKGFRPVSAVNSGVMGRTGIETSDIILGLVNQTKPDFVIVIDALASQSIERVNKTIQMTDTGIHPGSGIGNKRKEISKKTIGVPVIAVGVPTVVSAVIIVSDTINYMHKHYTYNKENKDNPINKLIVGGVNYLKEELKIDREDKEQLLGLVGSLDEEEIKQLIYEVLTPIGYNLMVTPKEIDFVIEKLSDVIGNGINHALHKNVDNL